MDVSARGRKVRAETDERAAKTVEAEEAKTQVSDAIS
jgi:hypothetical protein